MNYKVGKIYKKKQKVDILSELLYPEYILIVEQYESSVKYGLHHIQYRFVEVDKQHQRSSISLITLKEVYEEIKDFAG